MSRMKKSKLQITKVRLEHVVDNDADLSWIGEYTDEARPDAIIREGEHAGGFVRDLPEDCELPSRGREYRFFIPAMTGEETGNPESPKQDFERMEAYNRGDWGCIGIIAKAELWNPTTHVCQTVRSGGIWGVESDGKDYIGSLEKEELANLKAELLDLGIGERAIERAFKNVETVNK